MKVTTQSFSFKKAVTECIGKSQPNISHIESDVKEK